MRELEPKTPPGERLETTPWPSSIHFYSDCYMFGGSEHMLLVLMRAAADSDADVRFTYRASAAYEAELRGKIPAGVVRYGLRLPDPESVWSGLSGRLRRVVKALAYALLLRQLFQVWDVARLYVLFRADRPDVVHINNGGFPGAASCNAAAVAASLARVPVIVYVVNNIAAGYSSPLRWADYPFDRFVATSVTMFVSGSRTAAEALRRILGLESDRVAALPNGIAPRAPDEAPEETRKRLGLAPDSRVVLIPAQLERRKGHRHLLNAFRLLHDRGELENVRLLIAGAGPEDAALHHIVDELGLARYVRFVPPEANWWNLYVPADVVVLPSVSNEDFPNVVLEAMAMSKPVLASRLAGIPEQVIDGVTGLLVEPGDETALAEALAELLRDPAKRRELGAAGKARFRSMFTPAAAVERYASLYAALCGEAGDRSASPRY
jgi:glycosyltransferase involved in cell wall biosynthesis